MTGKVEEARLLARSVAEALNYVGVLTLEFFATREGPVFNEMAPRVHNSGHWTIEGAVCSQFENHLRAVLGLPLGDTSARGLSCMLNWVGELPAAKAVLATPHAHWHDYGKSPRAGRKVGHATCVAEGAERLAPLLAALGEDLGRSEQVAPVVQALRGS